MIILVLHDILIYELDFMRKTIENQAANRKIYFEKNKGDFQCQMKSHASRWNMMS